eukprot:scaffold670630_cov55-Prasinocladus_malaysianus.AAC.1
MSSHAKDGTIHKPYHILLEFMLSETRQLFQLISTLVMIQVIAKQRKVVARVMVWPLQMANSGCKYITHFKFKESTALA